MNNQIIFPILFAALFMSTSAFAEGLDSCAIPRIDLPQDELEACFGVEVGDDRDVLVVVAPIWQSLDGQQKDAVLERYRQGMSAKPAIVLDAYPRTSATMRILHADAIELGEQEFVGNMSRDPELEGLTTEDFIAYRDELLNAFLDGSDNSTLNEFVTYAPAFTEYVLTFPADFVFAEDLRRVDNIAELQDSRAEIQANIAELQDSRAEIQANIAEQNAIQAAYLKLQEALQGNIGE
ncbi:MAG: adenylate kinase family enzyme [Candidatus Azotimanducaceae bacterium]|jgi:adenylate kinase family enzyme